MTRLKRVENWRAVGIGVLATAVVLAAFGLGWLDWAELKTLDLRFQYANSMVESDRIVCIDIDDGALERVARWPWPRDVQAGVLSVLHEAGLRVALIDLQWVEPETLRSIDPANADIAHDPLQLVAADDALLRALPDLELRAALEDLGATYLATDYAAGRADVAQKWTDYLESDGFAVLLATLAHGDEHTAARQAANERPRKSVQGARVPRWAPLRWARLVLMLAAEPNLDDDELLARWPPEERDEVARALNACRAAALRRRVTAWFAADATRWKRPPHELDALLLKEILQGRRRYEPDLQAALRTVLSAHATARTTLLPAEQVAPVAPPVDALTPVYYVQAQVARRVGFVVFDPSNDGVMRYMPLLVQHGGLAIGQLAFCVACDELGLRPADITARPGWLTLRPPSGGTAIDIQLDARGRALVPWLPGRDWTRQFGEHVPIGWAYDVLDRRVKIRHNRALIMNLLAARVATPPLAAYADYVQDLQAYFNLSERRRIARYRSDRAELDLTTPLWDQVTAALAETEPALRATVAGEQRRLAALPLEQRDAAYASALEQLETALAANAAYAEDAAKILEQLRRRVSGRIGLIGYTATALADMAPLPTSPRAPGVLAHANLLNGLLQGRMVRWAPPWLAALPALLLGLVGTGLSVRYGPRTAALAGVLGLGYVAVAGWLAFYVWLYWLPVTPALGTLAASYVAVLVYRYVFLERERRELATALGQYTSATLARKMAEDAELCRRAEVREVTAVFTDLAGFTTISERIGAERTQRVLNIALGRFSDVILRYEGMINKFIGDGIFAFWNPVIYPQPEHARLACETAIDLQAELRALHAAQRTAGGDEVFATLQMRIGVATGNAVVGPCGSEQKFDYTCIGDCVNLAARLESANKFYGSQILVSGTTLAQAGPQRYAVRSLGRVQVKGKTLGIPVFELLGRAEDAPPDLQAYAARFAAAIAEFQARQFQRALLSFEACAAARPDDLAAQRYIEATASLVARAPSADWNGALELTEK